MPEKTDIKTGFTSIFTPSIEIFQSKLPNKIKKFIRRTNTVLVAKHSPNHQDVFSTALSE